MKKQSKTNKNIESPKSPIENIMDTAITRIKSMLDTSMVVGAKMETADGTTIIPLSKVSVGFVAGGGEYELSATEENQTSPFAGGSGAGFSVSPIGFAVIKNGDLKLIKVKPNELVEKLVDSVPDMLNVIKEKFEAESKKK